MNVGTVLLRQHCSLDILEHSIDTCTCSCSYKNHPSTAVKHCGVLTSIARRASQTHPDSSSLSFARRSATAPSPNQLPSIHQIHQLTSLTWEVRLTWHGPKGRLGFPTPGDLVSRVENAVHFGLDPTGGPIPALDRGLRPRSVCQVDTFARPRVFLDMANRGRGRGSTTSWHVSLLICSPTMCHTACKGV